MPYHSFSGLIVGGGVCGGVLVAYTVNAVIDGDAFGRDGL
jgi:hypothetical protein